MPLPLFQPSEDPGSNFNEFIKKMGYLPSYTFPGGSIEVPHGTTCVALRFVEGVVIAGDRRATAGNRIANRDMEKVVQTDDFSAVAIAGAAGRAMEMIKIFALSLEHYEKIEGRRLSLEGKANQLSSMVRDNMSAAMSGLGVLPLFAGFDEHDSQGRIWSYDGTGGRYEEHEYAAIGSGSDYAGTVVKVGWKSDLNETAAINLACRALWEAAEADSATGGPDGLRNIYPIVALIDQNGWRRINDSDLAEIFTSIAQEMRTR
jgi:proteasome beta subunit